MDDKDLWRQALGEQSQILALFGALGGSVRAAVLRISLVEAARVVFIGGVTSFGVGVLAPSVLKPYFGDLPSGSEAAFGTLCGSAFLIGLLAVTLIERALDRREAESQEESK